VDDGPPPGGFPMPDYASQWDAFTPCEILPLLRDVGVRWYVAAGWAVDLFVGRRTREHEDLEIAVPAEDFPRLRPALPQFEFVIPSPDRYWPVDDAAAFAWSHQTWARDEHGRYRFDVFREPWDGETWMYRRDPSIRRSYRETVRQTVAGIPYLVPEVVLLFKAKQARPRDEADLATALPLLDQPARTWLMHALERVHPGHPWLKRLR
jgi:hypothetical protein